jgi:hypothetical protein
MMAFFLREQIAPTDAYEMLHERVMRPMLAACGSLIGRLIGQPADGEETVPSHARRDGPTDGVPARAADVTTGARLARL